MCFKLITTFVNCFIFPLAASSYQTATRQKIWGFDRSWSLSTDFKEPAEECEDTKLPDYIVLLHKGCSNDWTTWSGWREFQWRRNCNEYIEWSP